MAAHGVYDYTPTQAEMVRFYGLYRCSLMNRTYHSRKVKRARTWSSLAETIAALAASSAVGSLAIWKTSVGGLFLTGLLLTSAIASVARSAFRLSENLDRYSRLAYAWSEMSLDMERVIAAVRRQGTMTDVLRSQVDYLSQRFQRIEMSDNTEDRDAMLRIQDEVDISVPPDRLWLPSV
jgi:hypothetical protein